ncbi:hypothetical protein I5748_016890 [Clostridioides difficile]
MIDGVLNNTPIPPTAPWKPDVNRR